MKMDLSVLDAPLSVLDAPVNVDDLFLDFLIEDDEPPSTEPRPELAAEWAAKMGTYPERKKGA